LNRFEFALYGASVDKPESNLKFATRLGLDYPILSDPTKQVARAYGVLKFGLAARRWTFVVDREGRIAHIDKKVAPGTAGADLSQLLGQLGVQER
jgi:peroxiredoxin Q/BCP